MGIVKIAADENFDNDILFAVLRAKPDLDVDRVQDTEYYGAPDPLLLDWLARENRVLLTHDAKTMVPFANERVKRGLPMSGVILVRQGTDVGLAMREILIALDATFDNELENQVIYIPF
jgi:hypothetical protein